MGASLLALAKSIYYFDRGCLGPNPACRLYGLKNA